VNLESRVSMYFIECEQYSKQWWQEKLGKPSASHFKEILPQSGKVSKSREGYLYTLTAERISGQQADSYSNSIIDEGMKREAESRQLYEMINSVEVRQVGMIYPDPQKRYLCSPDGIVDDEYGLELKNVLPKTQVKYLLSGKLPSEYYSQVQGSLLVSGFERWDFFTYSPGLPPFQLTVHRDEAYLKILEDELEKFVVELALVVRKLREMT